MAKLRDELALGTQSAFAPYVAVLGTHDVALLPGLWRADERALLEGLPAGADATRHLRFFSQTCSRLGFTDGNLSVALERDRKAK